MVETNEHVRIRTFTGADADFASRLHTSSLSGFFVDLGERFLRAYHETFAASPHGVAFVALLDGEPVGVLVGTTDNAAHYRWVLRHRGPRLAANGVLALLARPRMAVWFVRTRGLRYARAVGRMALPRLRRSARPTPPADGNGQRRAPDAPDRAPEERVAVLTHVCVSGRARGHGAGGALVDVFLAAAREAGAHEAQLVTEVGDAGAGRFYARRAWEHRGDRTDHDGRAIALYARSLR